MTAECGVALIQNYNPTIMKNNKKQYLLQVVEKQKHDLAKCNRDNLQDIQNTKMKIVINLGLGVAGTTF